MIEEYIQVCFFLMFLQLTVLILGANASYKSKKRQRVSIFPKSIKSYLAISTAVVSIYIYINKGVAEPCKYSLYVMVAILLSTIGDMMIFHLIKFKKGNKLGIYIISISNFLFGLAVLSLIHVNNEIIIILAVVSIVGLIALYVTKKVVLRKVYLWALFYGEGIIFFASSSFIVLLMSSGSIFIPFMGALTLLIGGTMVMLRCFFNVRFNNMTLMIWILYILSLIIMAYSPLAI